MSDNLGTRLNKRWQSQYWHYFDETIGGVFYGDSKESVINQWDAFEKSLPPEKRRYLQGIVINPEGIADGAFI